MRWKRRLMIKGIRGSPTKITVAGCSGQPSTVLRAVTCFARSTKVRIVRDDYGRAGAGGPGNAWTITLEQSLNLESLMDELSEKPPPSFSNLVAHETDFRPSRPDQYRTAMRNLEAKR